MTGETVHKTWTGTCRSQPIPPWLVHTQPAQGCSKKARPQRTTQTHQHHKYCRPAEADVGVELPPYSITSCQFFHDIPSGGSGGAAFLAELPQPWCGVEVGGNDGGNGGCG